MFLVNVKEALGYTHEQTLNSSYALITGMLQEYAYMCNERNKALYGEEDDEEEFEWVELVDFTTSEARRYKKYNNAKNKIYKKLSNKFFLKLVRQPQTMKS